MDFNLQEYLAGGVEGILKDALRTSIRNPKESLFLVKFSKHARKATKIRQEYSRNGQNIPAFLIASVTSRCNLHCKGCYSRANDACSDDESIDQLSADEWDDIFAQAKELGISFIVLAGGEPMMRRDIIAKASEYPEIYFQFLQTEHYWMMIISSCLMKTEILFPYCPSKVMRRLQTPEGVRAFTPDWLTQ